MTYEEIVASAREILLAKDVSAFDGHLAVQIDITGEGAGAFYVELKDKQLFVEPYEYYDRDCKLVASAENLLKITEGKLDAVLAFTTGKLKVEGDLDKALEFQKIVKAPDKAKAAKTAKTEKAEKAAPKASSKKNTSKKK